METWSSYELLIQVESTRVRCTYVDQNDSNGKDCYKNGDIKIWAPVLDDDASGLFGRTTAYLKK